MKTNNISPELAYANFLLNDGQDEFKEKDGVLYKWVLTHWQAQNAGAIEKNALNFLTKNFPEKCNTRLASSCASTATARAETLLTSSHSVIPTVVGYVHIENGAFVLKSADKMMGITYCLNCDFDPFATGSIFHKFVNEALPDPDVLNYLQEYAGYTLLSDCRHQLACWLIGGGGNGKSTFAQIMQALHRNPVSMQLDALDGFNLSELIGASLVYCDETPKLINEQRLKTLISGESVQVERKYRDPIVIRPTAKWIVSGNALPAISDHSDGFWRRWIVVPFNVKPVVVQPLLGDEIVSKELSGVLNWSLNGLKRLLDRGRFPSLPAALVEAQKTGKEQSNSVAAFVRDAEAETGSGNLSRKSIYSFYRTWSIENGVSAVSSLKFWERLQLLVPGLEERREREGGKQIRVTNLIFKSPEVDFFNQQDEQPSPADARRYSSASGR